MMMMVNLLLLKSIKRKKNDNKFKLHLHTQRLSYKSGKIIAMVLEIGDFARMFEALNYFQQREQIAEQEI
jgi:hypothetical protein